RHSRGDSPSRTRTDSDLRTRLISCVPLRPPASTRRPPRNRPGDLRSPRAPPIARAHLAPALGAPVTLQRQHRRFDMPQLSDASLVTVLASVSAANTAAATSAGVDLTTWEGVVYVTANVGAITGSLSALKVQGSVHNSVWNDLNSGGTMLSGNAAANTSYGLRVAGGNVRRSAGRCRLGPAGIWCSGEPMHGKRHWFVDAARVLHVVDAGHAPVSPEERHALKLPTPGTAPVVALGGRVALLD